MSGDIGEWLEGLGLARYAEAFAENEIDLDALGLITEDDLKEIGVALGARRKLLAAAATDKKLRRLHDQGETIGLNIALPALEKALAAI